MSRAQGVIHDIGYQRYAGQRLGRGYVFRSLFTHSLRTAYGLGRSGKAKIFPWLVVALMAGIAAVVTALRVTIGQSMVGYTELAEQVGVLVLLFCAVVAPELVSRDLRNQVLPLYFSRPLRRTDYAWAKLTALIAAAWLLLAGPLLMMFVGAAFTFDHWRGVVDEAGDLAIGLGYAGIYATVFASLALLVASLIARRAVAAGAVVAVFLVTTPIVGLLEVAGDESLRQLAMLFSPITLVTGLSHWISGSPAGVDIGDYGPVYGVVTVALVAVLVGLLMVRYRKVRA